MNTEHEINSPADAIRAASHAVECPIAAHENCVRRIVREELAREQLERDSRTLRTARAVVVLVALTVGAVALVKVSS